MILSIDPGVTGAYAVHDPSGQLIDVFDLPMIGPKGKSAQRLDVILLKSHLDRLGISTVLIELEAAQFGNGASQSFKFGKIYGALIALVSILGFEIHFVPPAKWKKDMKLTADKELCRMTTIDLYPSQADRLARKGDHNRAEAILLGRWHLLHNNNRLKVAA